jgi:DNA-nicking Smr family endonuclease
VAQKKKKKKKKMEADLGDAAAIPTAKKVPERISRPFAEALAGLTLEPPPKPSPKTSPKKPHVKPHAAQRTKATPPPVTASPEYPYEDRAAFNVAFAGVSPLGSAKRGRKGNREKDAAAHRIPRPPPATADAHARARLASLVTTGLRFEVHREDGWVEGAREGAPKGRLADLRNGRATVDAEIDLHGMTGDEAALALVKFLRKARSAGHAIVRVIHGKGRHSTGGVGVLGDRVVEAITTGAGAPMVHAFVTAAMDGGGAGALLVRLETR